MENKIIAVQKETNTVIALGVFVKYAHPANGRNKVPANAEIQCVILEDILYSMAPDNMAQLMSLPTPKADIR